MLRCYRPVNLLLPDERSRWLWSIQATVQHSELSASPMTCIKQKAISIQVEQEILYCFDRLISNVIGLSKPVLNPYSYLTYFKRGYVRLFSIDKLVKYSCLPNMVRRLDGRVISMLKPKVVGPAVSYPYRPPLPYGFRHTHVASPTWLCSFITPAVGIKGAFMQVQQAFTPQQSTV